VNSVVPVYACAEEIAPKQKTPRFGRVWRNYGANLRSPTIGADFYCPAQDINLPYELMSDDARFMSAPIIRIIKSFRKKN
jgi:hypothetical protein